MERFRPDGHLSQEALSALMLGTETDELARLEAAEHLAYCDQCLQRYTALLDAGPLLTPAHSCQPTLWQAIRLRALRLLTSRYATAAAAVALALTLLWGSAGALPRISRIQSAGSAVTEQLHRWPQVWNETLDGALSTFTDFFDNFDGRTIQAAQGGTHS